MKQQLPGLPSLNESRAVRRRQLATGKTAISGVPPKLFLGGLALLVVFGIFYFRHEQAKLEEQRARVLRKQRAVATELAPRLLPLRDAVEARAMELAKLPVVPTRVEGAVDWEAVFSAPSVYLRLRRSDATSTVRLRKAAEESLRDGFTACLVRDARAVAPHVGKTCKESKDCAAGELCSEYGACQRPSSPFNMRLLYRALGVLSPEWVAEVKDAGSDLALVAYERGLDSVTDVDIPIAIDVYQRAKYAILVLDDEPKDGLPAPVGEAGEESDLQRIQRAPHDARVAVVELDRERPLLELTLSTAGALRSVGRKAAASETARAAEARQANSCSLALEVRRIVEAR